MSEALRVLVASPAFPDAPGMLRERLPGDEIVVDASTAEGTFDVIVPLMTPIGAAEMDRFAPRLIQQYGVGLEGVDRDAAARRGIAVANVPAAGTGNSDGVGEVALLHLLALTRRYAAARSAVVAGELGTPLGLSLSGATVVVLGTGDVGRAVITRLAGFGARIVGVGARRGDAAARAATELGLDGYRPVAELAEAVAGARALIVCCVLSDQTRGIVDATVLRALGPDGFLVNVARGPIVDHAALRAALADGALGGAGLDVFESEPIDAADPLLALPVSVTPHIGGVTDVSYEAMADRAVANIERLRRGESVTHAQA